MSSTVELVDQHGTPVAPLPFDDSAYVLHVLAQSTPVNVFASLPLPVQIAVILILLCLVAVIALAIRRSVSRQQAARPSPDRHIRNLGAFFAAASILYVAYVSISAMIETRTTNVWVLLPNAIGCLYIGLLGGVLWLSHSVFRARAVAVE